MRGLEGAREYYERFGRPMLEKEFSDVLDRIAVGLVGEGSECLGYDDELSRDHDFEPGFCLWLTEEDERSFGFRLERAYASLPKEFDGASRSLMHPVGGNRRGVMTIGEFYSRFLGAPDVPSDLLWWLYTPSHALLKASCGEVFADPLGTFSRTREKLLCGYPEDVRNKKLAGHMVFMAQAGQYNYGRLLKRGEHGGAQLALYEFVKHAVSAVYLLNNRYEPFYKWVFRGMRELPMLGDLGDVLQSMLEMGNGESEAKVKREVIEDVARMLLEALSAETKGNDLEKGALAMLERVKEPNLRNMHVMDGV